MRKASDVMYPVGINQKKKKKKSRKVNVKKKETLTLRRVWCM